MACKFDVQQDQLVCQNCGLKVKASLFPKGKPFVACTKPSLSPPIPKAGTAEMPPLLDRVGNFAAAAARHIAAGAPLCTKEEVAARHAICVGCEFFDGKACTKCGCSVSRQRAYISKLSWATESCPVGKWGPRAPQVEMVPADGSPIQ